MKVDILDIICLIGGGIIIGVIATMGTLFIVFL